VEEVRRFFSALFLFVGLGISFSICQSRPAQAANDSTPLSPADGQLVAAVPIHFIGLDGKPMATPKLSKDDKEFVESRSHRSSTNLGLDGLQLPLVLLR
jgi:hypothetical protein